VRVWLSHAFFSSVGSHTASKVPPIVELEHPRGLIESGRTGCCRAGARYADDVELLPQPASPALSATSATTLARKGWLLQRGMP
jgi:hypothetical protein